MKKYSIPFLQALVVVFWVLHFWHTFADDHSSWIQKAELIGKYISEHRQKIVLFAEKYSLQWNVRVRENISQLDSLLEHIEQIKNKKIDPVIAEKAMIEIVKQIKTINNSLQYILRDEKESFELQLQKAQQKYQILWEKLSTILGQVILKIISDFWDTSNLSEKERRIVPHLKNLEWESQKLKNIGQIQFQNEEEIKQSFLRVLKNIKREIQSIYAIRKEA